MQLRTFDDFTALEQGQLIRVKLWGSRFSRDPEIGWTYAKAWKKFGPAKSLTIRPSDPRRATGRRQPIVQLEFAVTPDTKSHPFVSLGKNFRQTYPKLVAEVLQPETAQFKEATRLKYQSDYGLKPIEPPYVTQLEPVRA